MVDQPLANLVALTLDHGKYETRIAINATIARTELETWRPHLLLVDLDANDADALGLIGLRVAGRRVPTIVFSVRGDLKTKLAAFDRGADDIITVPFVPEELVARVLALMRRSYGDGVAFLPVIKVAGLEIDLLNQRVKVGRSHPELTAMEQALLYLLASNPGQTLGRDEILDALWGADYVAGSNVVDRHVRNLRMKLKDPWRNPRFIGTVPGKGYRFLAVA
ncbi:MAG: response regulator transcription factor [Candidatus Limnocylindria bacterium]